MQSLISPEKKRKGAQPINKSVEQPKKSTLESCETENSAAASAAAHETG